MPKAHLSPSNYSRAVRYLFTTLAAALVSSAANAHSFGVSYSLPVPLWLYGGGSVVALAMSFLITVLFMRHGAEKAAREKVIMLPQRGALITVSLLKLCAVGLLALCVYAGFWGHPNSYENISMTLFWIIFVLAFSYCTSVLGGVFEIASPWKALTNLLGLALKPVKHGIFSYPREQLGYWPAVLLYMGFIWAELFGSTQPLSLAQYLVAYTATNLLGSLLWGANHWFRYGELFAVFLRLIGLVSPFKLRHVEERYELICRWPCSALLKETADHYSLVIFILFMLSSTAFDGLHETVAWQWLWWSNLLPMLDPNAADHGLRIIIEYRGWYSAFQSASLFLSPFVYLGAYVLALRLGKLLAGSQLSMGFLCRRFAYSLLPIALVYHVTHYYTLLMTTGIKIIPLASDPFGWGWNLFATADWFKFAIIPDVSTVWHVQVITIVIGHIVSVYIAHVEALRLFGTPQKAALSQLPMLLLMMLFTTAGLWILAQPIQTGM